MGEVIDLTRNDECLICFREDPHFHVAFPLCDHRCCYDCFADLVARTAGNVLACPTCRREHAKPHFNPTKPIRKKRGTY